MSSVRFSSILNVVKQWNGEIAKKSKAPYGDSSELNRPVYALHCNLYLSTKKVRIVVSGRRYATPRDERFKPRLLINRWPNKDTEQPERCRFPLLATTVITTPAAKVIN